MPVDRTNLGRRVDKCFEAIRRGNNAFTLEDWEQGTLHSMVNEYSAALTYLAEARAMVQARIQEVEQVRPMPLFEPIPELDFVQEALDKGKFP